MGELSRAEILEESCRVASTQLGGTLATLHAEDGTPYVTFVLFHLREDGAILFGSAAAPQHSRNIAATPEVSFLIDNRDIVRTDWSAFDRVVVEGRAEAVAQDHSEYGQYLGELREKNRMAAYFTERGLLFRVQPRRLVLMKGFEPTRHVVDWDG